jgi:hypothetical protein
MAVPNAIVSIQKRAFIEAKNLVLGLPASRLLPFVLS